MFKIVSITFSLVVSFSANAVSVDNETNQLELDAVYITGGRAIFVLYLARQPS